MNLELLFLKMTELKHCQRHSADQNFLLMLLKYPKVWLFAVNNEFYINIYKNNNRLI